MSTDRPDDLAEKIVAALDRLAHAKRTNQQAAATRHGLTPLQVDLIATLADGPPPQPLIGLLATELGITQPTVTDSVQALERKGLLRRERDPADARRSTLILTATGRRLAEGLDATDRDLVAAIKTLPVAAQEETLEALLRMIAHLVGTAAITIARTCLTCRFHRHDGTTHRCALLGIDLPGRDLRVNCPEHQPA